MRICLVSIPVPSKLLSHVKPLLKHFFGEIKFNPKPKHILLPTPERLNASFLSLLSLPLSFL